MWQLARLGARQNDMTAICNAQVAGLLSKDPEFHALVIRLSKAFLKGTAGELSFNPNEIRTMAGYDVSSPVVRREFLLAARDEDPAKVRALIYDFAKQYDGKDRFYLEAIGIAVGHHDKARRDVILADFEKEFPDWNDKVADLVWELQPPSVMPSLAKRLADKSLTADQRGRIVDVLAQSEDKAAGAALLTVLESDAPPEVRQKVIDNLKLFLPNKWHDLRGSKDLTESIQRLMDKPETRVTALNLIAAAEKTDAVAQVAKAADDAKEAEPVRVAAVQTLGALASSGERGGAEGAAHRRFAGGSRGGGRGARQAVAAQGGPARIGRGAGGAEGRLHEQGRGPRRASGGGVGAGGDGAGFGVADRPGGEEAAARRRAARRGPVAAQQPVQASCRTRPSPSSRRRRRWT